MSTLSKIYEPQEIESKWYAYWMSKNYFSSKPDHREPYSIVIPPPNITGVLHLGHMLNNTIQDILIRRARMQGKNACWVPGTDHASIATEAKVVKLLQAQGIKKSEIGRETFLEYAFKWKDKYGNIILDQLKKLGASCDWDRTRFTMEEDMSDAVLDSFIYLYNKGYLYRDKKMVNWDPVAKTTLSNEEIIFQEEIVELLYIKYKLKNSNEYLPVATVRPETIMGDMAVAVHPKDKRYQHLIGKTVIVPMINREVPIVTDEGIEMEFGTGALKVTPAHDSFDYEIGKRYNLEVIDCFEDDGTISTGAQLFVGKDRMEARKLAIQLMYDNDLIIKSEFITHKVGTSERTSAIVEPRLSTQWFVKMDQLVIPALEHVMNDTIRFVPDRYKNIYKHWLENIRDWPISRQLWWGQQIPAWYDTAGNYVIAKTYDDAIIAYESKFNRTPEYLKQDDDVFDTWFSSWLWPISVFDGFKKPDNQDINYYYPTNVLVTGWDIIFFWVARMIFAGYEFKNEKPFHAVYFTGMVRDKQRRKMSKSLGNSPDTLELIDKYGADGLRFGIMSAAAAGNDILYDDKLCEQGRNFSNKLWNATKLIYMWKVDNHLQSDTFPVIWMKERVKEIAIQLNTMIDHFHLSEGLKTLYSMIWDDFCSSYLEWIKPAYEQPIAAHIKNDTIVIFEEILALLHPFMPFITEEIYHQLKERNENDDLIIKNYPNFEATDNAILGKGNLTIEIISTIREIKARNNIKPKEEIELIINGDISIFENLIPTIRKCAYVKSIKFEDSINPNAITFVVAHTKMAIVAQKEINIAYQARKLTEELEYTIGFRNAVLGKLSNEKFIKCAPATIIATEKKKLSDANEKILLLEESLSRMS